MNIGELIGGSAVLIATMAALSTPTFAGSYGPTAWIEPPVARPNRCDPNIHPDFWPITCGGTNAQERAAVSQRTDPKTTRTITRELPKSEPKPKTCRSCEIETERRERNRQEWLDRGRQPPANGKPGRGDGKGWDRAQSYRERCL